jgi:hypothetical protein
LGHTHTRESARGGAGGDDVQFFNRTTQKKEKKKFFFFFYVCEPLTLHSSAPPLSNYTPTPWAAALSGGGKIYKREK